MVLLLLLLFVFSYFIRAQLLPLYLRYLHLNVYSVYSQTYMTNKFKYGRIIVLNFILLICRRLDEDRHYPKCC